MRARGVRAAGEGGGGGADLRRELLYLWGGGGGFLPGVASRGGGWSTLSRPQTLFSGAPTLVRAVKLGHPGEPGFCFARLNPKAALLLPPLTQRRGSQGTRAASVSCSGSLGGLHSAEVGKVEEILELEEISCSTGDSLGDLGLAA